ncbi:MAG: PilZ domain-containing protein [Mariprofundaceae bacterium]
MSVIVSNMKKPVLYEDTLKILYQVLGHEQESKLAVLAAYVCDEQVETALEDVLKGLFHHGFTIPVLLSALLQCESMRMQRLFSGYSALPIDKQFDNFQHVIHHFNDIQEAVLNIGKDHMLQAKVQFTQEDTVAIDIGRQGEVELDTLARKEAITSSLKQWGIQKRVDVFNFFQGVPVHVTIDVIKVEGEGVFVKPSADLVKVFSSHVNGEIAYASCADGKNQVRVSVGEVLPNSVELVLGEVAQSVLNCRKSLGVHIANEVPVILKARGRIFKRIMLRDISSAGLGFAFEKVDGEPCQVGELIECSFQLGDKRIDTTGWVRWVMKMNGEVRMGMELRKHVGIQQTLQKEVFRIQRQIILALSDLDVPKKLAKAMV